MGTTSIINELIHNEQSFGAALAAVTPEMEALPRESLLVVNLDIPTAASTVVGCIERTVVLCDPPNSELPYFTPAEVRKLRDYAMACQQCQVQFLTVVASPKTLQALDEEAVETRTRFHLDAMALSNRGLIGESWLEDYKGTVGYGQHVTDLGILIAAFRGNWPQVAGKCAVEASELDRAEKVAALLLRLSGMRADYDKAEREASDKRTRAFTLMVQRYEEVRRSVTYLRWQEDDADLFTPSLYAKGRRPSKAAEEKPEASEPAAVQAPTDANGQANSANKPGSNPFLDE